MFASPQPLAVFLPLIRRSDAPGRHARHQFLRILMRKELLADARIGLVDGVSPDDVDACLHADDAPEVFAKLCADQEVAELMQTQLDLDELGYYRLASSQLNQRCLF